MEDLLLFFGYILYSVVASSFAIAIIDSRIGWNKIIPIGILSGIADFLVKEVVAPKFNLPDGIHLITGVLFLAVFSYTLLKLKVGISFGVSIFTYVSAAISETAITLIFLLVFGKETLVAWTDSKITVTFLGLITTLPLVISLIVIKLKNIQLLDFKISNNFYRM